MRILLLLILNLTLRSVAFGASPDDLNPEELSAIQQLRVVTPVEATDTLNVVSVPEDVTPNPENSKSEGASQFYVLESTQGQSGIVKTTTELFKLGGLPIEKLFWYSSIPALTISKLTPYYLAGAESWVLLPVAAFILVKAPVITVAKSMVGLQIRARVRAKNQAKIIRKQIKNIDRIYFMQGFQTTTGHAVTHDVTTSTLFLIKTKGVADTQQKISIPNVDDEKGQLGTQEFKLVETESFTDTRFEFRLGSHTLDTSSLPKFDVSFEDLLEGVRLPENLRQLWYAPMHSDWKQSFSHLFSKENHSSDHEFFVELKMKTKDHEVVLGNYTSSHGVKGFLGETFMRKVWSRIRYMLGLTAHPHESTKLVIQDPSARNIKNLCKGLF